jgi:DNA sulfur modification protein DndE
MAASLTLAEIGRLDFRTSRSGDTATAQLGRALDLHYRYQPARLAIGRSLGLKTPPPPVENFDGKVIRGETLFGQTPDELAAWATLIVEHQQAAITDRRILQDLVAAHWARGAGLLWDSLREARDPVGTLAQQLSRARA